MDKANTDTYIRLPAISGTVRDPSASCIACKGISFLIKSDGPNQAWLKCMECGERQPSSTPTDSAG
jgi:hypothetical protein